MSLLLAILLSVVNNTYTPSVNACNGVTATFNVPWSYDSQTYLVVTSTTAGGASTTLSLSADYTLSVVSTSISATLTLTNPAASCPSGNTLKIARSTPQTQPTTLSTQFNFLPQTVMQMVDRTVRELQEVAPNASQNITSSAFANQGSTTTVLHGNPSGNLSFSKVVDADVTPAYSGVGSCAAHQWASTLNRAAVPTCAQPDVSDLTGVLPAGSGGTGSTLGGGSTTVYFGDGSDGSLSCSGVNILTKPMYYSNLTILAGCDLRTNNWPIYVNNTLEISAAPTYAITNNGTLVNGGNGGSGASGGGTQGAAGAAYGQPRFYGQAYSSGSGGLGGQNAVGQAGTAGGGPQTSVGALCCGAPGAAGAGGAATNGGGSAGGKNAVAFLWAPRTLTPPNAFSLSGGVSGYGILTGSLGGGGGGGGGAVTGTATGGGGGGAGGAGSIVVIRAYIISRGSGAAVCAINANGGNGGNGGAGALGTGTGAGGGGAGPGGGGGLLDIAYDHLVGSATTLGSFCADGGPGGNGGALAGTGANGTGGDSGFGGIIEVFGTAAGTTSITDLHSTQNLHSGQTGGAAVQTRINL